MSSSRPLPAIGHRPDVTRTVAPFEVVSEYSPSGDQPTAIEEISERLESGERDIVLLGATGTGKSATTAWLIEQVQRPTLIMAPNKTLAAQLANEFRQLLPNNAVEYFVSYYDYYQPRRTSRRRTRSSRRTRRSTTRSNGCGIRRRTPCSPAATSSSSRRSRASTASAPQRSTSTAWSPCAKGRNAIATNSSNGSSRCSTPATTWRSRAAPSACAGTPWRSSRSTRSSPCASSSSATRSNPSRPCTR